MTTNNLDALPQDAELPFGHPGCRYTPEGFDWTMTGANNNLDAL